MGLRVNTNIASLNAQRNLFNSTTALSGNYARLSSGLRIAVAADDAAGLGISERMRADIRSYSVASRNAQDGISLVQTAEGALSEVSDVLGRMRELSMQSANGTLSATDRQTIDREFQQLVQEIDRIADTTTFNGVQQVVDANQRLQQLALRTQIGLNGLDDDLSVYEETFDGQFIDYLVGLVFEQPIGNRGPEAQFRQRRLERQQAVISFRNTVQNIVREVKDALDSVRLNYALVNQTQAARIAAAESLRSLEVQLDFIQGRTALQLDQLLTRQERVANAEQNEIQAIADFNRAIADLHRATGTILERNRIEVVVPNAGDEIRPWYGTRDMPEVQWPTPVEGETAAAGASPAAPSPPDEPVFAPAPSNTMTPIERE